MKQITKWLGFLLLSIIFFSCKNSVEYNRAGLEKLNKEVTKEFGPNLWFTSVELTATNGSDEVLVLDMTKDPASKKQERWVQTNGFWNKDADITLDVQGADPASFMFQLDKGPSLGKLGELIENSQALLLKEQKVAKANLMLAAIKSSNKRDMKEDGTFYYVTLRDSATGKDYMFKYDMSGKALEH